jgi:hypothetical protein
MPRYVIERQYLVPMYEHILVEAPTVEDAFRKALDDIEQPWENVQTDYENSGPTTIELAVELPSSMDVHQAASLAHLLYDAGLEALFIPEQFVDEVQSNGEVGFV